MAMYLIALGALIFGLLGSAHWFYTFYSKKFEAFDDAVTQAMQQTTPNITKHTTLWNAWIGFNASHSLGAIFIACVYIPLSLSYPEVIAQSIWFSILPTVTGCIYLLLAHKYWFNLPFIGILIATCCFTVAAIMLLV